MSDIQQHDEFFYNGIRYYTQEQLDAAVAEARNDEHGCDQAVEAAYEQGQRDALAGKVVFTQDEWRAELARNQQVGLLAAVTAVEGLDLGAPGMVLTMMTGHYLREDAVIAAIKAVGEQ
jgi:nitroreductase